jgi:hypothetical protein
MTAEQIDPAMWMFPPSRGSLMQRCQREGMQIQLAVVPWGVTEGEFIQELARRVAGTPVTPEIMAQTLTAAQDHARAMVRDGLLAGYPEFGGVMTPEMTEEEYWGGEDEGSVATRAPRLNPLVQPWLVVGVQLVPRHREVQVVAMQPAALSARRQKQCGCYTGREWRTCVSCEAMQACIHRFIYTKRSFAPRRKR